MNNRRFQLENEIENQDNRNRMGLGFFFIIMLAFPMQYYLANNMGQANLGQRSRDVSTIVRSASNFAKNWMTIASWEARVESFNDYLLDIANKLEERQYKKSKQAAKVYTIEGESPAHEVLDLLGSGHGYFGHSSDVRTRRSTVKYHVGQVFKHKKLKYYGVIVGWDYTCRAPNNWKLQMLGEKFATMSKQPFFSVLTNQGDSRYVAQENIEIVSGDLMMTTKTKLADHLYHNNPNIMDYFDIYDDDSGTFIPRAAVAALYPED